MPVFAVESCERVCQHLLAVLSKPWQPDSVSSLARFLLIVIGGICIILGFIGLAVPLMPGFIFFGLAIICLSSGSSRLHKKMLAYPSVGAFLKDLESSRDLGIKARIVAGLRSAAQLLGGSDRER